MKATIHQMNVYLYIFCVLFFTQTSFASQHNAQGDNRRQKVVVVAFAQDVKYIPMSEHKDGAYHNRVKKFMKKNNKTQFQKEDIENGLLYHKKEISWDEYCRRREEIYARAEKAKAAQEQEEKRLRDELYEKEPWRKLTQQEDSDDDQDYTFGQWSNSNKLLQIDDASHHVLRSVPHCLVDDEIYQSGLRENVAEHSLGDQMSNQLQQSGQQDSLLQDESHMIEDRHEKAARKASTDRAAYENRVSGSVDEAAFQTLPATIQNQSTETLQSNLSASKKLDTMSQSLTIEHVAAQDRALGYVDQSDKNTCDDDKISTKALHGNMVDQFSDDEQENESCCNACKKILLQLVCCRCCL